jgi:chemotaxis protein methyltransferase CheR
MLDSRKPPPSTPGSSIGSAMGREQGTREFSFSSADFERVRKLIYQHAGISLSPVKQDMVYSRLARRLRATGTNTFGEYLDLLERGGARRVGALRQFFDDESDLFLP